jgi:hypothetical protein
MAANHLYSDQFHTYTRAKSGLIKSLIDAIAKLSRGDVFGDERKCVREAKAEAIQGLASLHEKLVGRMNVNEAKAGGHHTHIIGQVGDDLEPDIASRCITDDLSMAGSMRSILRLYEKNRAMPKPFPIVNFNTRMPPRLIGFPEDAPVYNHGRQPNRKPIVRSLPPTATCDVCGRSNHVSNQCRFHRHPDRNRGHESWACSVQGKKWQSKGHKFLSPWLMLDGTEWLEAPPNLSGTVYRMSKGDYVGRKRGRDGYKEGDVSRCHGGTYCTTSSNFALFVQFVVVSGRADKFGDLIQHPVKPLTQNLLIFLDIMSRETLISETLVSHLAVQGFVVKAPKALLKEKFNVELLNDLIVKPVDSLELHKNLKLLNTSVHPFVLVLEPYVQWAFIGGADMVKFGLLGELQTTLTSLDGSTSLYPLNHTLG